MNRDVVLAYAVDFACYVASTRYGHHGDAPAAPAGLTDAQADCIRRAAGQGRRAGVARDEKDEARAACEHDMHRKSRPLAKLAGFTPSLIDECFAAGYRTVRTV